MWRVYSANPFKQMKYTKRQKDLPPSHLLGFIVHKLSTEKNPDLATGDELDVDIRQRQALVTKANIDSCLLQEFGLTHGECIFADYENFLKYLPCEILLLVLMIERER